MSAVLQSTEILCTDVSGSKQRAGTLTTNVPYRPARPARKHSTSPPLDPSSSSPRLPPPASPRAPPPKPRLPTMGVPPASAYAPQPAGADGNRLLCSCGTFLLIWLLFTGRDDESLPERPRGLLKHFLVSSFVVLTALLPVMQKVLRPPAVNCQGMDTLMNAPCGLMVSSIQPAGNSCPQFQLKMWKTIVVSIHSFGHFLSLT